MLLSRSRIRRAAAALAILAAGPVAATSISVLSFARDDLAGARAAYRGFADGFAVTRVEDFEAFGSAESGASAAAPLSTSVGLFAGVGADGSGASAVNSGRVAEIRSGGSAGRFGRRNLTDAPGARNWLDSNDLGRLDWTVSGVGRFDRIGFFLTDAGDVSGALTISAGGAPVSVSDLRNGAISVVAIHFDQAVDRAEISFRTTRNDGFGIDEAAVGISAIPLPAALPMLAVGFGALAAVALRRIA